MENKYDIKLWIELACLKKLNIGATGQTGPDADIMFARVHNSLFIPGSSIKGVMRSCAYLASDLLGYTVEKSVLPETIGNKEDIVVSLFGAPGRRPSKVYIMEVLPPADKEGRITNILTHVSIEDSTRVASKSALYTVEYTPPAFSFKCRIEARGLNLPEAELLFASLAVMRFSRFGRDGMIDVHVLKNQSMIPSELLSSELISIVMQGLGK